MSEAVAAAELTIQFTMRMRRAFLAVVFLPTAIAACGPSELCGGVSWPDYIVRRIAPVDTAGRPIVAKAKREYTDGTFSELVPIDELWRIDPSMSKGRGSMNLVVTAPGFESETVQLAQSCEFQPEVVTVILKAIP